MNGLREPLFCETRTRLCESVCDYVCPACNGDVTSDIATGQIDHRTVCGNKFSVKDGVVQEKCLVYRCPFCNGNVKSNVRTGRIDHRSACGNQFHVKDGAVSKETRCRAHSCPVCSTVVWSSQSGGRIAVTHDTPARNIGTFRTKNKQRKRTPLHVRKHRLQRWLAGRACKFSLQDGVVQEKGLV